MNRRKFLKSTTGSFFGASVGSLLTGLPPAFLASGYAYAEALDPNRKVAIIAQSGSGEGVNGCGPGSFDSPDFIHPGASSSDLTKEIGGTTYTSEDLSETTTYLNGVRIARIFECLGGMQDDMAFFHHRTQFGIHPQFPLAQKAGGAIRGFIGRGEEELASAIAQENYSALGCLLEKPIVLSGSATYNGSPLNTYKPTLMKELVSSSINAQVPSDMFGAARNYLIDKAYREVKRSGNPNQQRFLDEYAISQEQANEVASRLYSEVVDISDDSLASQMKMAAIIAKLRLAPAVVVDYRFTGDNHNPEGLSFEAEDTLNMMAAYREFYDFAQNTGVWGDCLYATLTVFGRSMNERGNGRGHNGSLCTGLLFGQHLCRKVVGGIDPNNPGGVSLPFNGQTGSLENPNVSVEDSFACYVKSVMKATGISNERLEQRVRDVPAIDLC